MESVIQCLPVPGYLNLYTISEQGLIKSVRPGFIEKQITIRKDRAGYLTVRLHKDGFGKTFFIHRLLATVFIPNPQGYKVVNHINGIKTDNRISNLEWVTHSQNIQHAYRSGLVTQNRKKKTVIDVCTGSEFSSVKEAANYYDIPYATCKNYLNGNRTNITCLRFKADLSVFSAS